jgi:hypothetical protein
LDPVAPGKVRVWRTPVPETLGGIGMSPVESVATTVHSGLKTQLTAWASAPTMLSAPGRGAGMKRSLQPSVILAFD